MTTEQGDWNYDLYRVEYLNAEETILAVDWLVVNNGAAIASLVQWRWPTTAARSHRVEVVATDVGPPRSTSMTSTVLGDRLPVLEPAWVHGRRVAEERGLIASAE